MSRNKEVKEILKSREIARQQNLKQKQKAKRESLENGYVRNSLWPSNRR